MVHEDWAGNAWSQIFSYKNKIDLLLVDLFDERHGIYRFTRNEVVTRTAEIVGTPLEEEVQNCQFLKFGTSPHFKTWKHAADVFAFRLRQNDLFEKTVVVKVPWAKHTREGKTVPSSMGLNASEANQLFARYYAYLQSLGLQILDLTDFPVYAEPLHQWGLAPFHYTLEVYKEMTRKLTDIVDSFSTQEKELTDA
ncbi:hypothetical protein GCM10007359_18060 [Rothia aerolata]|uniref:Uncharacterized protein n=2 Tax=Rothia aerolata TaxID=1812262 RepID=A0A917IUS6_9MICC|nr:hypothetical protein GCM10007359_18060 [Rothia aerolata]